MYVENYTCIKINIKKLGNQALVTFLWIQCQKKLDVSNWTWLSECLCFIYMYRTCISLHEERRKTVRTQQKLWKYMYPSPVSVEWSQFNLKVLSKFGLGLHCSQNWMSARLLMLAKFLLLLACLDSRYYKCARSPIWQNWEALGKHACASLWMFLEIFFLMLLMFYWNWWCTWELCFFRLPVSETALKYIFFSLNRIIKCN